LSQFLVNLIEKNLITQVVFSEINVWVNLTFHLMLLQSIYFWIMILWLSFV